jgi:hypothetical protein
MHWIVLKKEIMLNVEDISLMWTKEKHLNIDCSGVLAGVAGIEPATYREAEPDLHLSMHPALQKLPRKSWLPVSLPRVSGIILSI